MSPYARSLQKLSLVIVQAKEPEAVPEVWTPALMMLTTTPEAAVRGLCDYDIEVGMPVLEIADEYRIVSAPVRPRRLTTRGGRTFAALPTDVLLLPPETDPTIAAPLMADERWQARVLTAAEYAVLLEQEDDCRSAASPRPGVAPEPLGGVGADSEPPGSLPRCVCPPPWVAAYLFCPPHCSRKVWERRHAI